MNNTASDEISKKRRLPSDSEATPVKHANVEHRSKTGNSTYETDNQNFNIIVSNLPKNWDSESCHKFFTKLYQFKSLEIVDKDNFNGTVRLKFHNEEQCETAIKKLENTCLLHWKREYKEENISSVETLVLPVKSELDSPQSSDTICNNQLNEQDVLSMESFEIDPSGLYGLKPSFLSSLGLKAPIDRWVHVSDFRCDESQLRNVLSLAGHVVICSLYYNPNYAKVMYSHPLEAVQAVSMLNGQELYRDKLKIFMIPNPGDFLTLPKGLAGIGPGLGWHGKPLREIEKHYSRFLTRKPTALNKSIFRELDDKQNFAPVSNEDAKLMTYVSINTKNIEKTDDSKECDKKSNKSNDDKITDADNSRKKCFKSNIYEHDSDSELSLSSPEPDGDNSKFSDDKAPRPRSNSTNSSNISKNQSKTSAKTIEIISGRQSTRAPNAGPTWTPNVPSHNVGPTWTTNIPTHNVGPRPNPGCPGPVGSRFPHSSVGIHQGQHPNLVGQIRQTGPIGQYGLVGQSRPMMNNDPRPGFIVPSGPIRPSVPIRQSGPIGPSGPVGQSGAIQTLGPNGPIRPSVLMVSGQNSEPVMLEFKNLPPNTTMPFFCQLLSDIGQVVSLQFTTPGCALVRFANMAQAQTCFQRFHRTVAEGCVLDVRFV